MIRSQKVINAARGAPCSCRFPGICGANPETTVWAHLNGSAFGKGMGVKAHDVLGFDACDRCHAYYDVGHGTKPLISNDLLLECVLGAVCESYVRRIVLGVIIVPRDVERLSSERPVAKRKPPAQRVKIASNPSWPEGRKLQSRPMGKVERTIS